MVLTKKKPHAVLNKSYLVWMVECGREQFCTVLTQLSNNSPCLYVRLRILHIALQNREVLSKKKKKKGINV